MTPSPRTWVVTFSALVFLIGALAGVVVDRSWLLPRDAGVTTVPARGGRGMGPGGGMALGVGPGRGPVLQPPDRVIADLDNELHLTADQQTAIRKILDDWRPRVQVLQDSARQEFVAAQEQLIGEIAKTLTTNQAKRFQEISPQIVNGGRGPRGMGPGPGAGRGGRGRDERE